MKWGDIPSSKILRNLIQQQLDLILPSVHGYSLITLGELTNDFDYSAAAIANIISINCGLDNDVIALPHNLPLASDDIDAIFIPLLIEQSEFPHQLLREVTRSLRPGGKLILVTFNPISVWGIYRLFLSQTGKRPWCFPFYRLGRLIDWMSLLGLEITVEHGLFAKLPGSEYKRHWKSRGKDKHIGSKGYSRFGALNFLVVEKKIKTLTAIRPTWGQSRMINPGVIEPSSKVIKIIK
ncbi:MAG: class I SAM-dependent methyltransferase [Gammaproteobacteria bacterium]|nr:class I SAM-dependent methyltransferase [Gammaproteobacteria bacterium]